MAKSLEEHLYRSATSKEEYLDMSTLKTRLHAVAQNLEVHRSSSSTSLGHNSVGGGDANSVSSNFSSNNMNQVAPSPIAGSQNAAWQSNASGPVGGMQVGVSGQSNFGHGMQGQMHGSHSSNNMNGLAPQQGMMHQAGNLVSQQAHSVSHHGSVNNLANQHGSTQFDNQGGQVGNVSQHQNAAWSGNMNLIGQNNGAAPIGQMQPSQQQQSNFMAMAAQLQQGGMSNMQQNLAALQQSMNQAGNMSSTMSQGGQSSQGVGWDQQSTTSGISQGAASLSNQQSRFEDSASSVQKKRVILQQQQRLLLLRHASKCTAGTHCPTKFCSQMVTLWRHMKNCRDKDCRTSHCLSSRCVLNHYRICKANGKTATCEVCGPVMSKIKQIDQDDSSVDPLAGQPSDASVLQPPIQPPTQVQIPVQVPAHVDQSTSGGGDQSQLEQLQSQQMKLQARLENLRQLQKQQEQLLEQQRRIQEQASNIKDPTSQQAQQLQQQQLLLSQLQQRCQQQQLLLQQELQEQNAADANPMGQQLQGGQNVGMPQQLAQQVQGGTNFMNQAIGSLVGQSQPSAAAIMASQMMPAHAQQEMQRQLQQQLLQNQQQQQAVMGIPSVVSAPALQVEKKNQGGKGAGKGKRRGSIGKGKGLHQLQVAQNEAAANPKKNSTNRKNSSDETTLIQPEVSVTMSGVAKPIPDTSLITSMTKTEILKHLESLNKKVYLSSRTVTHKCMPVIQALINDQFGWVFHDPVDPVALGLPDYFDVVKNPMHLELVKKKVENAIYPDMESFERDVKLVFENAILYNGEASEVGELAQSMLDKFDQMYKNVVQGTSRLASLPCTMFSLLTLFLSQISKHHSSAWKTREMHARFVAPRNGSSSPRFCIVKGNVECSASRDKRTTTLTARSKTIGAKIVTMHSPRKNLSYLTMAAK